MIIDQIIKACLGDEAYEAQKNNKTADIHCTVVHNNIPQ